jgi:hypothetical protein
METFFPIHWRVGRPLDKWSGGVDLNPGPLFDLFEDGGVPLDATDDVDRACGSDLGSGAGWGRPKENAESPAGSSLAVGSNPSLTGVAK